MKLLSVMADYQSRNSFPPAPSLPCTVGGCLSFCLAEESGPGYSQEPPLNRLITSLPQLRKGLQPQYTTCPLKTICPDEQTRETGSLFSTSKVPS